MKTCLVTDLGLAEYGSVRALETRLVAARKAGAIPDVLLLCEHPHVITQGRNGKREHLLASQRVLDQMGVAFFETNRGGDITYHGPGQLVGYPILNLSEIRRDVGWYVCNLEEAMIRATQEYGIASRRVAGKIGVWVEGAGAAEEKLAAIGVHLSRWVTSHGFAYNVAADLRNFDLIVPCGIAGRKATSLEKLLGRQVNVREVAQRITGRLGETLGLEMTPASPDELFARLQEFESNTATPGAREVTAMA
jgi:lipoyl(octanoyl) transferase